MGKKITLGVLLLIILIIVNVIIGGTLFFFIQDIKDPRINIDFNFKEMTSQELNLTATIRIENKNLFDLSIKNLTIDGKTPEGNTILQIHFIGGTIPANQQRIFTTNQSVSFSANLSSKIYGFVQGTFGVNFAGIFEKTIPFHINITASLHDLLQNISTPQISLLAEILDITEEGVLFHAIVSVQNPNPFEITLVNLSTCVETEQGTLVGEFSTLQGQIIPNGTTQFPLNGTLSFDALNAKILTLNLSGYAGFHLMGINKTIELHALAQLSVPNIKELLFKNKSLGITISLDAKLRFIGFLTTIGLTLYNPNKIPLQANDLLCSIYGLNGENKKMIGQTLMKSATVEPIQQNHLEAQLIIPYRTLFTSGIKTILPKQFVIQIDGDFSIAGVAQTIPVLLVATINPHLLRS
jgi:LEA14-like dessication related protein